MASPISLLPTELHIIILSQLPFVDQIRASQTCTFWQTLLKDTKILESSRYHSPQFFILQTHKLLGLFTHRLNGKISLHERPVPSGLVFRVENQRLVECFYYQQHEDNESINGGFTNLLTSPTSFINEPLFKPLANDKGFSHNNGEEISITLYSKKKMFIFCLEWVKRYNSHAPPTVKEMLETIITEAHYQLESDWGVYSDEPEVIKRGLDFEEGCWLAAHILTDLQTGDIDICLRRVEFS
ncbi:hypothetical protein TWF506_001840 [Arthrobotrys conoides]|uniref:F-box domain-containing protein n=1 Tax=Arthrobotrys conoides TaxID=74498 RepID=A0AAN8S245_9PEZI